MTCRTTILGTAVVFAAMTGAAAAQEAEGTWRADLMALNAQVAGGEASGSVTIAIQGDTATISVDAKGVPAGIAHLQHIHGFADSDKAATCPAADADANGDGVIDLIETEAAAGTTMVPFDSDPLGFDLLGGDFPEAYADGNYSYEQTVELPALMTAFGEKFPDQGLDLDRRVVFIHGVPEDADLPDTAQSLGDVAAHVTLPIACGALRRDNG